MNKAFKRMHETIRFKNAIAGFCRILEIHPQKMIPILHTRIFIAY